MGWYNNFSICHCLSIHLCPKNFEKEYISFKNKVIEDNVDFRKKSMKNMLPLCKRHGSCTR